MAATIEKAEERRMIGACSFLRKKSHDSDAAFYAHWLNVHGPLAAQLHGVKRYFQSHFIANSPRTNDLARSLGVNGMAEMWFENERDREICYASEQERICDVDSLLFIGASARVVTDIASIAPLPASPAKGKRIFLILEDDARDLGKALTDISALDGLAGLVDHRVTKAGAEPTQEREAISIKVERIVSIGANDPHALDRAQDIMLAAAGPSLAVFDCIEHRLV